MSEIVLGTSRDGKKEVTIDLQKLVSTRLLVFAGSGYGKSWLLRRLMEQTHDKIHQLILDREGDFYTLRKKYTYLLASADMEKRPEIVLTVDMAETLAETIMRMRVSIIIDLSSLEEDERIQFVDRFIKTLLNLPKEYRHHALVLIDEIQEFCDDAERISSTRTLKLFAEQARKRGYCPIYATQRIAETNKTAISQCHNRIIGAATIDIDVGRALSAAGFPRNRAADIEELDIGNFWARGPAMSPKAVFVKVGDVETPHPQVGMEIEPPVPVTSTEMQRALAALRETAVNKEKEEGPDEVTKRIVREGGEVVPIQRGVDDLRVRELEGKVKGLYENMAAQDEIIKQRDAKIQELSREIDGRNDLIVALREDASLMIQFRELFQKAIGIDNATLAELNVLHGEGAAAAGELSTEQADITVTEKVAKTVELDESTLDGKLLILIADGFFSEEGNGKGSREIHSELDRRYPGQIAGWEHFRKNLCGPAMRKFEGKPYEFVRKEGNIWWATDKAKKYLRKKLVEVQQ